MQIFSCVHPQTVFNRFLGDYITVPCGKCDLCRSSRALSWVDRLEIERKCHPYCIFFTLTYTDDTCPRFMVDFPNRRLVDECTGEMHTFSSLSLDPDSFDFIKGRKYICYQDSKYLQDFIKRLRSKVCYYETNPQNKRVRYYISSEYGPSTQRIHHHGLLFFESSYLANHAKEIIDSAWSYDNRVTGVQQSYGLTDVQFVDGDSSSASYVASYVNCVSRLPKIFRHKIFAPRALFSKSPSIGSLLFANEDLRKVFDTGAVRVREFSSLANDYVYKPLPQAFKDRLYPKIKGFRNFDFETLVKYYGLLSEGMFGKRYFIYDFHSFCDAYRQYSTKLGYRDLDFCLYMDNLFQKESALRRYYSILVRFENFRYQFGLSVREYVRKIVDFYKNNDYQNLLDYFEFQQEYCKISDPKNLLWMDDDFVRLVKEDAFLHDADDVLSHQYKLILKSYGFDEYSFSRVKEMEKGNVSDYVEIVSKVNEKINKSHKTRCKNEYLEKRNSVSLSKIFV